MKCTVEPLLRGHPDKRPLLLEGPLDNVNLNINILISTPDQRPPLLKAHLSYKKGWPHKRGSTILLTSGRAFPCKHRQGFLVEPCWEGFASGGGGVYDSIQTDCSFYTVQLNTVDFNGKQNRTKPCKIHRIWSLQRN